MLIDIYTRPNGTVRLVDIKNVYPADEEFFEHNNIKISMEDIGGLFAIYADMGRRSDDGNVIEIIEISHGRSCEETLNALRMSCEREIGEDHAQK